MPRQWHQIQIVAKCDYDDGYNQTITLWVEAYGRERAIAIAMIQSHTWSDNEIELVRVLATEHKKPDDADVIQGEGYD